ncbi:MAG: SUMF1/EgtB/PvdO family nonheme iron enzyme, partial [Treponema sp.]|nr:SUMF1/EgtB/PvdO family nonheme iron enzyme [Treponema sp.]
MIRKLAAGVIMTVLSFSSFAQSKMVKIPSGSFNMGSPASERQRNVDEKQHSVSLSSFYADAYEVTQKSFQAVMGKNPSVFKGDILPVENVTWFDAIEYCNRLSEKEGLEKCYTVHDKDVTWNRAANGYRLLTEAEWEYACRAGTTTIFNTGNWNNPKDANYEGEYPYLIEENYVHHTNQNVQAGQNRGKTIAVDSLAPNKFGLYNMHGNVSEWVFDFYGEYDVSDKTNPAGNKTGIYRVNRGGAYNDFGKHLRSAYRSATNPLDHDQNLGFRVARNDEREILKQVQNDTKQVQNDAKQVQNDVVETKYDSKIASIVIPKNPKILIPYFSYSGNTESAAKYISKVLKAKYGEANVDLVEIEMVNPYRGGIYEVTQKDLNAEARPPLKTKIADMAKYDVVLLGYPTWWATLPMPVMTFLESYDFSGKTIISFSSHGGTRYGDSVSDLGKKVQSSYL